MVQTRAGNFGYTKNKPTGNTKRGPDSNYRLAVCYESQTQRVFQVSMDDDLEEGLRYTVGIWLELINKITSDKA